MPHDRIGVEIPDVDAGIPQHPSDDLPSVCGEREHMRDDLGEQKGFGRFAQCVDDAVLPGSATIDVTDSGEPARCEAFMQFDQGGHIVWSIGWCIGTLDGGQSR